MRNRGNQSMYQTGGKSMVGNKSMAVSKVMGSSMTGGLQGKSMIPNQGVRKVEGHDVGNVVKGSFEQTISKLKSKPSQRVLEDEYINVVLIGCRDCRSRSNTCNTN
jgi:methyl coenzyme M reductase subunit C-like uncharacterized protein (methanogenesis marker protein 7)